MSLPKQSGKTQMGISLAVDIDMIISDLLDAEDMRTSRELYLERSKSFRPENCGNHKNKNQVSDLE